MDDYKDTRSIKTALLLKRKIWLLFRTQYINSDIRLKKKRPPEGKGAVAKEERKYEKKFLNNSHIGIDRLKIKKFIL
mgnify:CR=1 FL=1